MKKILFIFISISMVAHSQQMPYYYWNDVGITLQQLFVKMGVPDDVEYQSKSCNYWFAYDFGEKAVIYIIDKGLVSNIIFMESGVDRHIASEFIAMLNLSLDNGFKSDTSGVGFYIHKKDDIVQTASISRVENEYVLTILITKMKQK